MKCLKKALTTVLALLLAVLFAATTWAVSPSFNDRIWPEQKLHDLAGLVSAEDAAQIEALAQEFVTAFALDLALVTVDENPDSAKQLADDLYDDCGFGPDGLLFLVDMDNRELYISTKGQGREIYDPVIDDLLDEIADYFSNGQYADGFLYFVEGCAREAHMYHTQNTPGYAGVGSVKFPYDADQYASYIPAPFFTQLTRSLLAGFGNWVVWLIALIVGVIYLVVGLGKHRRENPQRQAAAYVSDALCLRVKKDERLGSHIDRVPIPKNNTGASRGGRSSFGGGHGGGGRKF